MSDASAKFVSLNGVTYVAIHNVDEMAPFLMSVVNASDLWMFIASNGGLTAGRGSPQEPIFSYETVDRLYDRPGVAGPVTGIRNAAGDTWLPWAPGPLQAQESRHLYKSVLGDRLLFETEHDGLGVRFRAEFEASDRFGWVRSCGLSSSKDQTLELIDGVLDVMPAGVQLTTQQRASCLVDAYRHTELHPSLSLGLFTLSSRLTDRAEPSEALLTNVVWQRGLEGALSIDPGLWMKWRQGTADGFTHLLRGTKGAFLISATLNLKAGKEHAWHLVMDAGLDTAQTRELATDLERDDLMDALIQDLSDTRRELSKVAAHIDGLQSSARPAITAFHLANAMFNGLRGGVFLDEGRVSKPEIVRFFSHRNRPLVERHQAWIQELNDPVDVDQLRSRAAATEDADLIRLADEIMPLGFGRRHGDPSRPWNQFSIQVKAPDGTRRIYYEGNWRDIFQNWEAAAVSYPQFLPSMVAKFVNATTVDGFNPYRISWDGIDWEIPDPEDPWSNIGYWGDHQVIYLLKLLEALDNYQPQALTEMMLRKSFSFAQVPYRLVSYTDIAKDPRNTIEFSETVQAETEQQVASMGMDGRLVLADGRVAHTHLLEKLLILALAKVSNLVPEGGIWMNTQRPEWNDANNALAGPGLSVVTTAHLLRFVRYLNARCQELPEEVELSKPVAAWMAAVSDALPPPAAGWDDSTRRASLDKLGNAFEQYRDCVYRGWTSDSTTVARATMVRFFELSTKELEHTLRSNQREDGLFHSYNTLDLGKETASIQTLPIMLEGQVSAIDARILNPTEVVSMVETLFESPLYRADQETFILYPNKTLPGFLQRNQVPRKDAEAIPSAAEWLTKEDTRILIGSPGRVHFRADLVNEEALDARLADLEVSAKDQQALRELYEKTFQHASFTGRSGGMYAYEGLGSVYWHMAAKLLYAVQDTFLRASADGEESTALAKQYHRLRAGFASSKSAKAYGAFPTDPYSHTPAHAGAQQPGMTGMVKEMVLCRFGELGVRMQEGKLTFMPRLLTQDELHSEGTTWYFNRDEGTQVSMDLPPQSLAFVLGGVPVVYQFSEHGEESIEVEAEDGSSSKVSNLQLSQAQTKALLARGEKIRSLKVSLHSSRLQRLESPASLNK